jgi:hypothetical protein
LNNLEFCHFPPCLPDIRELAEKNVLGEAFRDGMEVYAGKPVETELDFEEFYNETFKKDENN